MSRLQLLKLEPDESTESIVGRSISPDTVVRQILSSSLSRYPHKRKSLEALVHDFLGPISLISNRDQPFGPSRIPISEVSVFQVWEDEYQSRDAAYQQIVLTHLTNGAHALKEFRSDIVEPSQLVFQTREINSQGTDSLTSDSTAFIQRLTAGAFLPMVRMGSDLNAQARLAFQIAMSHCLEIGTRLNKEELVKWIYIAAKGGLPNALWIAPLLEDLGAVNHYDDEQRKACLVIGAWVGSKLAMKILRNGYPEVYTALRNTLQSIYLGQYRPNNLQAFMKNIWDATPY